MRSTLEDIIYWGGKTSKVVATSFSHERRSLP
jgi:hypothetical protein